MPISSSIVPSISGLESTAIALLLPFTCASRVFVDRRVVFLWSLERRRFQGLEHQVALAEAVLIANLDWPRSCQTQFEGPADEWGPVGELAVGSSGPWPIGFSSSTLLYRSKSAADAAIKCRCEGRKCGREGQRCWICEGWK